ncbi:MAG: DUF4342 domain-containing protein [Balneolales bacterium]
MKNTHITKNAAMMSNTIFEEIKVSGNQLLNQVKKLIRKGNVRRVIIKDRNGRTLVETPLTFGVAGVGGLFLLAPFIAAVAAAAVIFSDAKIVVERYRNENDDDKEVRQDYIEIDVEDDKKD